jgi:hypothetical protein
LFSPISISRSRNKQTACHSRAPSRQSPETKHLRRGRLWRGLDHFKTYIWSAVVAHNLVLLARRKPA